MYEPAYNPGIKENGSRLVRVIERIHGFDERFEPHVSWENAWGSNTDGFGQTMNVGFHPFVANKQCANSDNLSTRHDTKKRMRKLVFMV